jgi:hypothetical protein
MDQAAPVIKDFSGQPTGELLKVISPAKLSYLVLRTTKTQLRTIVDY